MTNFIYTLLQIVHNFGAAMVVGSPAVGYWLGRGDTSIQRRLAWLTVVGAVVQIGSGIGFGLASQFIKGQLPEIEGVALVALLVKLFCVAAIVFLMLRYVITTASGEMPRQRRIWLVTLILGGVALAAAAFLRWYL